MLKKIFILLSIGTTKIQFKRNMETIYSSRFAKHEYDSQTQTLFTDWFSETEHMSNDDFMHEMRAWLEVFRQTKPKYLYDNCVNFMYPIVPVEQIWMAELLNAEWIKLGLKKYAHMVPADMITELSVEQSFEEFFEMRLPNQFPIVNFAEREAALKWLYQ